VPTIAFRDLAIQKRENDLVGATFGRGFFVLDDYSPLRQVEHALLQREAALFAPRRAWWYIERDPAGLRRARPRRAPLSTPPQPALRRHLHLLPARGLKTRRRRRQERREAADRQGRGHALPRLGGLEAGAPRLPAIEQRLADLGKALARSQGGAQLDARYEAVRQQWADLATALGGNPSKAIVNEPAPPTLYDRYFHAYFGVVYSTYGPTPSHRRSLEIAEAEWKQLGDRLRAFQLQTLPALEAEVIAAGAPWAPGQALPPPVE
jgi:hypothetical protein